MKISKLIGAAAVVALAIGLSACAPSNTPVIAPVTVDVGDLQDGTVELVVGQVLNINTGDLAVDSYSGEVEDTSVAEFVKGYEQDGATYNPGVKALAEGSTQVVLSNSDGGIEDVTFTVDVGK
ncbi:hypothetical protein SAMN04487846_1682 [Microbacterium sp. cf046]|uniref:hypothetical protein n=1 Tax=Microbacterium sp. cf046 TaxID=1761803 RepID=UPI0008F096C2|nr:hypothetical protein [Microbacterium sp. cf046]SFS03544.1 hypothetical protein SAMN04487846_1682 [Microbacterium sp. cf046]